MGELEQHLMSGHMGSIGEKNFIAGLMPTLRTDARFLNGYGDDASIIDIGCGDLCLVMKIDRAAQPIASKNGWADYAVWGRLAVTANCSDILAVGGQPVAFMLSMCLSKEWRVEDAVDIIRGCQEECEKHGISFVGGDTKESREAQIVGCACGTAARGSFLSRKGAEEGDILAVAGRLGGFVGAYRLFVARTASGTR